MSLPQHDPYKGKPKGLYTCLISRGPQEKRTKVKNLLWSGGHWRYPEGYPFRHTVHACYGPIPTLELSNANARIHLDSPQN